MLKDEETLGFGPWALLSLVFLLVVITAFGIASQFPNQVGAVGVGGVIFFSSAMVGALLGFIFAVPRVIARDSADPAGDGARRKLLDTNTNLERISDWLTTMLVGVGLSQLTNLNELFLGFRIFLAETATVYDVPGGPPHAGVLPAVGPFILVLGAASGFLFMYLMTRLVLVGFFRESEEKTLSGVAVAAIRVAVAQAQADQEQAASGAEPGAEPAQDQDAAAGEHEQARDAVRPALKAATSATFQRASQATTLSNDEALEVMFELLYDLGGYQRVIQMSGELSRTAITKRAEYWFYLAAAFGQLMHHAGAGTEEYAHARERALHAANEAIKIDRSYRGRLWEISNPNSTDNDLALLRDDEEFRRLVASGRK